MVMTITTIPPLPVLSQGGVDSDDEDSDDDEDGAPSTYLMRPLVPHQPTQMQEWGTQLATTTI